MEIDVSAIKAPEDATGTMAQAMLIADIDFVDGVITAVRLDRLNYQIITHPNGTFGMVEAARVSTA